jgi:hypothetical protein
MIPFSPYISIQEQAQICQQQTRAPAQPNRTESNIALTAA